MAQFNNTTKKDIKDLNPKQTVILELVTDSEGKKTLNVYLGNWKRRQDAYYIGMVGSDMKEVRKGDTKKHYRLLKLSKVLAEVSVPGYNTKTNYLITESYDNDVVVKQPNVPEEVAANPEVKALVEDLGLEVKKEEKILDAVVTEDVE